MTGSMSGASASTWAFSLSRSAGATTSASSSPCSARSVAARMGDEGYIGHPSKHNLIVIMIDIAARPSPYPQISIPRPPPSPAPQRNRTRARCCFCTGAIQNRMAGGASRSVNAMPGTRSRAVCRPLPGNGHGNAERSGWRTVIPHAGRSRRASSVAGVV